MDYKEKYETALEGIQEILSSGQDSIKMSRLQLRLQGIFPELKESEDERIRRVFRGWIYTRPATFFDGIPKEKMLAWLEKQGEQKPVEWSEEDERIYQSIMDDTVQENQLDDRQTKWLSNIKYRYVPQPKQEWSEEDENMVKDIIAAIDTLYYYGMVNWLKSLKDRIPSKQSNKPQGKTILEAIKEESVDNSNKIVNPKFKIGDWVVVRGEVILICDIRNSLYDVMFADGEHRHYDTNILDKDKEAHLWAIDDAEDGDILYSKKHNLLWRYKNTKECYYCINLNYSNNISIGDVIVIPNDVRPACKEQRDLLSQKLKESGYEWDSEKKELKKQGEHNPTDNSNKVEPKFHEGDWITNGYIHCKISDVLDDRYIVDTKFAKRSTITFEHEDRWHLWTIQDAKDGDVLVASDGSIFIFAGVVDDTCKYYVSLTVYNGISINKEVEFGYWELANHVHPATKEQCDLLFAKMREKGYKWINEKKEVIRRI